MSRRTLWILVVLFALTRIPVAWVAMNPPVYEQEGINAGSDVDLYHGWASALVNDGQGAYSDIRIEYPPGSLPFMLIPEIVPGDDNYLSSFVVMMAVIDVAGFKYVNDSLGHQAGDELLVAVARRIESGLRAGPFSLLRDRTSFASSQITPTGGRFASLHRSTAASAPAASRQPSGRTPDVRKQQIPSPSAGGWPLRERDIAVLAS